MAVTTDLSELLLSALNDTLWMARRYADGRSTYATSSYNDVVRRLDAAGVLHRCHLPDGTPFARDGMGASYSGLSDAEYSAGLPRDVWQLREAGAQAQEIERRVIERLVSEGWRKQGATDEGGA